jgi:putative protease
MKKQTEIELLAPAKDLETGKAAINCGADAVYIGAPQFGARAAAGNSLPDIATLANYAHRFRARIYVTLNTLLHDAELDAAVHLARALYEAGADGLIIQDMGLLECDLPPLPLIASTQTNNRTPEKVAFLEKVGFQRVILARELALAQILEIRRQTTVELEYFIHGALCVSFSGQCYLSYALGGRSGNRGECAQPCRQRYALVDRHGKILRKKRYLLSLKDLNQTAHLEALLDAGISSFKIEGRLKDIAYVRNIVGWYRQHLDTLLTRRHWVAASSGRVIFDFVPNPAKTFNRGYTDYFFTGRQNEIAQHATPKSTGEFLGTVTHAATASLKITTPQAIHPGDGLCFLDDNNQLTGMQVNRIENGNIFPRKLPPVKPGTQIFRNHDHEFIRQLEASQTHRKIGVKLRLAESADGLILTGTDTDGCAAEAVLKIEKPPAERPRQALETIRTQLIKLGNTDFADDGLEVALTQVCFVPRSQLNELRRQLVENLAVARERQRLRTAVKIQPNNFPYPETELTFTGNILNQSAAVFYRRHGVTRFEAAAESGLDLHQRVVMTTRYCLKQELGWCPRQNSHPALAEPLFLEDNNGHQFRLEFSCDVCEMRIYFEK